MSSRHTSWILVASLVGCSQTLSGSSPQSEAPAPKGAAQVERMDQALAMDFEEEDVAAEPAPAAPGMAKPTRSRKAAAKDRVEDAADGGGDARAWFPEAFLWAPDVVTDENGEARVAVTVPDTLTTWRVLALAHVAEGGQAGAVHSFVGSLPTYVDVTVPKVWTVGDRLSLPVQVVHEGADPLSSGLDVMARGAADSRGVSRVSLGSGEREVFPFDIQAVRHGSLDIEARLDGQDTVVRRAMVRPAGRAVHHAGGGLIADRAELSLPDLPARTPRELDVWVFAGPRDVFRGELERLSGPDQPWSGAYGWALAERLEVLAKASGVDVDAEAVRRLKITAWQRLRRQGRAASHGVAADILLSFRGDADDEVTGPWRRRLVRTVVDAQRGDGTWARQQSASLQEVLVQTAVAARALPEDAVAARVRASGALERYANQIDDPFTAAVVVASGLVDEGRAEGLRDMVRQALLSSDDGRVRVDGLAGVRNVWGGVPRQAEALTWASLALADDGVDMLGPQISTLMQGYDVRRGFGAGVADPLVLDVLANALPALSEPATVTLKAGGKVVASGALETGEAARPALLSVEDASAAGPWTLEVSPPVAGLAWRSHHRGWLPWGDQPDGDLDVEIRAPATSVGQPTVVEVTLTAVVAGSWTVDVGLPPGATAEAGAAGRHERIARAEWNGDRVQLTTRPLRTGEVVTTSVVVTPAFRGDMSSAPHVWRAVRGDDAVTAAPTRWRVR